MTCVNCVIISPSPSDSLHKKRKEALELSTAINSIKKRIDQVSCSTSPDMVDHGQIHCNCSAVVSSTALLGLVPHLGCHWHDPALSWQVCHYLDEKGCGSEEGGGVVVRSEGGEEVMGEEEYQVLSELKQVRKKEPFFWSNTSD